MSKRPILITIFFLLMALAGTAQQIMQSAGGSVSIMRSTLYQRNRSGRFNMTHIHANYFPRVSFPVNYFSTISVGIPLGIGLGIINNDFFEEKGVYLSYDLPLVIDYNVGFKASEPGDDKIGFYFGMGIGYTGTQRDTLGVSKFKANSTGILGRVGVRLGFDDDFKNRGISIGFFHKIGFSPELFKTSGINVMYDF